MLSFFTTISFLYLVLWSAILPRLAAHVKTFDPSRGRREGTKVIYPMNSHEGKVITGLVYGSLLFFGGSCTLGLCLVIWFFKLIF